MRIGVVGLGASGTLVLSHLAGRAGPGWRGTEVCLFDGTDTLGRGLAFGHDLEHAALNSTHARLSAISPVIHPYDAWLRRTGLPHTSLDSTPLPRSVVGDYLARTLARSVAVLGEQGVRVRLLADHVRGVHLGGAPVLQHRGGEVEVDRVVMATGGWGSPLSRPGRTPLVQNAYPLAELRQAAAGVQRVGVMGTGLTAVDAALALLRGDAATRVHLFSRSGMLPWVKTEEPPVPSFPLFLTEDHVHDLARQGPLTLGAVLGLLEQDMSVFGRSLDDVASAESYHRHWRDPLADPQDLDCHHVLSQTNRALNAAHALMEPRERDRLRTALGPAWSRYRIRLPYGRWAELSRLMASGRLQLVAGVDARNREQLLDTVEARGIGLLVNATGRSEDLREAPAPLTGLFADGLLGADGAGRGLVDVGSGQAVDAYGEVREDLYVTGQAAAGSYYTVSALDVIAQQAERVALSLAGRLDAPAAARAVAQGIGAGS